MNAFILVMICGSLMIIHIIRDTNKMERESIAAINKSYADALTTED